MNSNKKRFKKRIDQFKEYEQIAGIWEIGRRVFAKNSFDGILTIIGIIMGSYFANVTNPRVIIITGIGACIAMGVSGIWATYFTEQAERRKKMLDLEKQTLTKMRNTKIEQAEKFATIIIALIDGLSPFFAALIVLVPFMFVGKYTLGTAYVAAIVVAFIILALLGAFLGKVSEENIIKSSLKMAFAGIICMLLTVFLQHL